MQLYDNEELYKSLKELEVIPEEKLETAYEKSEEEKISLDKILLDQDLISEKNIGKLIADIIETPFVELSKIHIEKEILKIIPEIFARSQMIIPFKVDEEGLHVATTNPKNKEAIDFVSKKIGKDVIVYFATEGDLKRALSLYSKDVEKAFDEIIAERVREAKKSSKPEPSIIKIVDTTITYAFQNMASDVHIEPLDEKTLIRFRIDGIMHDIVELPVDLHPQIVTRVKILAKLRTDEHQAAQDGKIEYEVEGEQLDIRVSIVPITDGEKIVMRLLSSRARQFSLKDLGFSDEDFEKVENAYNKPHGMILATGPTGSGKTTTLYSILKNLNQREVNIMTIEDPVEYDIEFVNQIQVNTKTDLTFAKGLRSIVRQDPDIILVGEIRDEETADIAINAAMTGHLLLSTLHTNDSATAIPRLLDLGAESFLVSSTVNVIIAQRLVRKICTNCRISVDLNKQNKDSNQSGPFKSIVDKYFEGDVNTRVYEGKGCKVCHQTGYMGRVGIFEVMVVNEELQDAIVQKKDAETIKEIAIKNGMRTMLSDGIDKIKNGVTTMEEVLRVTKE